ncbi:MAG: DNA polymerase III subunit delta [Gemmatimonadota bacterium]
MGELTYDQLRDRLARGKLGGNYFLKTEDTFLRDEAIRLLIQAHLNVGSVDLDLDQLGGDDADVADLASRLDMPPMISNYRVVVIRDAQGLAPRARGVVESAVAGKASTTVLIVAATIPKGSKAKFYSALSRDCTVVALRMPRASEVPGWLAERARALHDVELDMRAAELLAAGLGGQLGPLVQELEKLVNYVEPEKRIGPDQVRSTVSNVPPVDRWSWIDTVMERRFPEALAVLPALLDSRESGVALIGALSEALLRVGLARSGESALVDVLKRERAYGNLRWKVGIYRKQARGWKERQIDHALHELLQADRLIKSGGLPERAALEEAILRIAADAANGEYASGRGRVGRGRSGG